MSTVILAPPFNTSAGSVLATGVFDGSPVAGHVITYPAGIIILTDGTTYGPAYGTYACSYDDLTGNPKAFSVTLAATQNAPSPAIAFNVPISLADGKYYPRFSSGAIAPTLAAPTFYGTTATIAFSGGGGYSTLIPQYSLNGVSGWTSIANDLISPFTFSLPSATTLYYFRALPDGNVANASNVVSGTTLAAVSGQLPAGHYVPQKMAMTIVLPRPDSETGAYTGMVCARHRWAYYDGVNAIQYEFPIVIQGGSRPFVFSLMSGPPGMTIGAVYGTTNYGVVTWTPTAAIASTAPTTCVVRVTGQDGNTTDITWSVATSSSTSKFVFLSSTGNDSTGIGSISSPFRSLAKLFGTMETTTTYPGAIVYMRAGSYAWPARAGDVKGTNLDRTYQPIVYLTYPGETVNIDGTPTQISFSNANDFYFSGSTTSRAVINGSSVLAPETHGFTGWTSDRCTWWNIDFTNPQSRVAGDFTNSTSIFSPNASPVKNYWSIIGCTETGRTNDAARSTSIPNDMSLHCLFSLQYAVTEFCSITGGLVEGPGYKDSNRFITMAFNKIDYTGDSGRGLWFADQSNVQTSYNLEACYNFVRGGGIILNSQAWADAGAHWSYRNTILRSDTNEHGGLIANGGLGPYSSDGDVIVCKGPEFIQSVNNAPAVLETGSEIRFANGSGYGTGGIIDPTTGQLQNIPGGVQYRTLYLGTRGYEIA